jgi:hypothetical protein
MAIFGAFKDILLTEILPTLSKRSGKLFISGLPSGLETEIYINNSIVTAIITNKKPLELVDAHRFLQELAVNRVGDFEFFNEKSENIVRSFEIGLVHLLTGRFELPETNNVSVSYYADTKTRFAITDQNQDSYLGFELDEFWRNAHTFLISGASAEDLSRQLQIPLVQTQSYLYRLRANGRIQPLRAFTRATKSEKEATESKKTNSKITSQNTSGLQAFSTQGSVSNANLERNPVMSQIKSNHQELTNSISGIPKQPSGILNRLLSALRFLK